MDIRTIGVVISREYATRVKKKSFLVITFLVPVLFAALCCVPALIMMLSKDETKTIAVIDQSGIVIPTLESNREVQWADCSSCILDSLKAQFSELPYEGIVYISPITEDKSVNVATYAVKPLGMSMLSNLEKSVEQAVQDYRIEQYDIAGLKNILDEVRPEISVKSYTISEDGEDKISNAGVYMALSMGFGIIIFMFVTMFSSAVMQSVVEEKQSKVVEVLLSSVRPLDLMFGKIIGVALVALTQFLLWIVLTVVLVSGLFAALGTETLMGDPAVTSQMMTGGIDPAAMGVDASAMGMDPAAMTAVQDPTMVQEIMQTLSSVNYVEMITCFLLFFILGYLLYASLFAAIGSAVESMEDSQNLQMPLTIPLMLGYFIAIYSWNAPDSALAVWGSMIPFTSPIVMLARIPFGVPVWQIALSLGLLLITFVLMAWLSAKIYRIGILTSGKKASWKDLWKWIRM